MQQLSSIVSENWRELLYVTPSVSYMNRFSRANSGLVNLAATGYFATFHLNDNFISDYLWAHMNNMNEFCVVEVTTNDRLVLHVPCASEEDATFLKIKASQ